MSCYDDYSEWEATGAEPCRADPIVVGVDGSEASIAALRWARDEAHRRGADLHVVHVFQPLTPTFTVSGFAPIVPADPVAVREAARHVLRDALRLAGIRSDEHVRSVLVQDETTVNGLVRAACGASMLVVGVQRHHGLGKLLGSTAAGCVRHAACPIVAVPVGPVAVPVNEPAARNGVGRKLVAAGR